VYISEMCMDVSPRENPNQTRGVQRTTKAKAPNEE
jgi:hypothetical protein